MKEKSKIDWSFDTVFWIWFLTVIALGLFLM